MTTGAHSLFSEPWWLDAVAPGAWDEVVVENGGGPKARLPFMIKRRLGVTALTQPPLTPMLGPWLAPSDASPARALSRDHGLMEQLIESLPPFHSFSQAFDPSVMNWLPFYWAGFEASVKYTYRIEDLDDVEQTWSTLRSKVRQHIRKAEEAVEVRTDLGVETFLDLNEKTFARQGLGLPYSRELVRRVDEACAERDARSTLFAVDAQDAVHAAIYLVRDSHSTYQLMTGADPDLRSSGAGPLLTWEGIKQAAETATAFDFEGSMIRPVERYVRDFGPQQVPYLHVTKRIGRGRAAAGLQQMTGALRQAVSSARRR